MEEDYWVVGVLIKIYLSKFKVVSRSKFCDICGIKENETLKYKKIIEFCDGAIVKKYRDFGCELTLEIDKIKLQEIIVSTDLYKNWVSFQIKYNPFSIV